MVSLALLCSSICCAFFFHSGRSSTNAHKMNKKNKNNTPIPVYICLLDIFLSSFVSSVDFHFNPAPDIIDFFFFVFFFFDGDCFLLFLLLFISGIVPKGS